VRTASLSSMTNAVRPARLDRSDALPELLMIPRYPPSFGC
jgi:hypothetical protein